MKFPTERMKKIPFGGIREVFEQARKREAAGRRIVHMEIGRPDFDTPEPIKEAAVKALQAGSVQYTSNYGLAELRETVARKLTVENKVPTRPEEVIVTPGASVGLALAMIGLVDIGDEVLIPTPAYGAYAKQARLAGAVPISVPLRAENGFLIDVSELEERVTDKTQLLIINTPHNPTGAMLDREILQEIAAFAIEHDLIVISDECYEKIVYDKEHLSLASLPGMKERTVIVNSASKTFSMTGWRVGFVSASEEMVDAMIRVQQDITICANSFAQAGGIEAFSNTDSHSRKMVEEFSSRRELVLGFLDQIPGLDYVRPAGAFYVFPSVAGSGMNSEEFAAYILEEAGVAIVPGTAFGEYGEGFVRLAYACSREDLSWGMERFRDAVNRL